jgi:hypothetical protein
MQNLFSQDTTTHCNKTHCGNWKEERKIFASVAMVRFQGTDI